MKKGTIAFLLLSVLSSLTYGQSYTAAHQAGIKQQLNSYRNDEVTGFVNETLQLFDSGTAPSQQLLTGTYALGVVYIMDQPADCSGSACSNPAVDAAAFESGYSKMGVMRIRRPDDESKRPLAEYAWMFQSGRVKNTSYSTKYILEYLGQKVNMHAYTTGVNECVIGKNTFVRQNGSELIAVSFTADYSKINIYRFSIDARQTDSTPVVQAETPSPSTASMQKVYEVETTGTPPQNRTPIMQKEYAVEDSLADKPQEVAVVSEYDKVLADMLQQVINNRSLTVYYKSDDIYIVSSGLFREYLVVKYKDKPVQIQSNTVAGKANYVQFVSSSYDGKTTHNTEFHVSMPTYGVGGKAVFKYTGSRWFLSEFTVVAE